MSKRRVTNYRKDRRRKHHHWVVTLTYSDGEKFCRKVQRASDACRRSCYAVRAGFAVKMPLKLSRYGMKTSAQSTQATSAGAIVSGESVMWKASML